MTRTWWELPLTPKTSNTNERWVLKVDSIKIFGGFNLLKWRMLIFCKIRFVRWCSAGYGVTIKFLVKGSTFLYLSDSIDLLVETLLCNCSTQLYLMSTQKYLHVYWGHFVSSCYLFKVFSDYWVHALLFKVFSYYWVHALLFKVFISYYWVQVLGFSISELLINLLWTYELIIELRCCYLKSSFISVVIQSL